jgi:spore coat protein CotH
MKKSFLFLIIVFLAIIYQAFAQPDFPPNAPVFDSSTVARIDITVDPDTLEWIYENVESDIEFHATFKFDNGTINETHQDIGFRLRGNTSRYSRKKSFKISFNTFESGRKFYGMEKLNLNGEHNDPSIIRSRICWDWLRAFNVPAPRSTHTEVYINGNYYGLYIMVEHVDEEFVESRFGNKEGNLYMCLYPADLDYLGSDPDLYKLTSGDRQVYELKTNTGIEDYSDLARFIDVLNNTPLDNLECELEKVFNLNDYLKIMAIDVITGNWDGYIYNKNNFYLYHNTATDRFEYIPYDLDNTLGIDWLGPNWGTRNIYDWEQNPPERRPLYTRLLGVPEIRDRYSFYMKQLLDMLADEDSLFSYLDQIRSKISSSVIDDPYYPLDYGYTFADFLNSYNQALGDHVDYGLKPYIQARKASALQQLVLNDIPPAVNYISSSKAIPGEDYWVKAFVEDEDPSPDVQLLYRVNNGMTQFAEMVDDGQHQDNQAGDGFYGCVLPPFQFNQTLSWQIKASDHADHASMLPCLPAVISFSPSSDPQLFINELLCDNDTTIADEYGEYDNWLEIYNGDDTAVWIGDKYLSDNLLNPDKWQLPDLTMQPGAFILIWCDNQPEQGPFHTNFKLNDEGEEAGIFDNEGTGYYLIDSVSWGAQQIDISFGRQTDGGLPWVFFNEPTPGYSNETNGLPEEIRQDNRINLFPNPVIGGTIHFGEPFSGMMTDMLGKIIRKAEKVMTIDVNDLDPGIYMLRDAQGACVKVFVR